MSAMNALEGITMNEERYVGLLTKLIGEVRVAMCVLCVCYVCMFVVCVSVLYPGE